MTRNEAINTINSLYPADSEYIKTAEIGQMLLLQAKNEINGWKNESDEVLIRYAELCISYEERIE